MNRVNLEGGKKGLVRALLQENVTVHYLAKNVEMQGKLTFGYRKDGQLFESLPQNFQAPEGTIYGTINYYLLTESLRLPIELRRINLEKSDIQNRTLVLGGNK